MSNQVLERETTSYPLYFVNYWRVHEKEIFCRFVEWCALPKKVREPRTQGEFARMYGLHIDTLTDWKKREGFQEEVDRYRISYFREFASDIYYALVQRALTGNVAAVRLYAEIFEGFRA
jgi:hypothetical protein